MYFKDSFAYKHKINSNYYNNNYNFTLLGQPLAQIEEICQWTGLYESIKTIFQGHISAY